MFLFYSQSWSNFNVGFWIFYWTKVLGTSTATFIFSRFPALNAVNPFRNFLTVVPPPTLYKVETRKKFWIHASNIVLGVRGGGWTCVHWKAPQKRKSVPRTFVHDCRSNCNVKFWIFLLRFTDLYNYRRAFCEHKISPIVLYCYSIEDRCEFS